MANPRETEEPVTPTPADPIDTPIYWFTILELAIDRGDFEQAAEAQRELARLGVRVQYGRPQREVVADGR